MRRVKSAAAYAVAALVSSAALYSCDGPDPTTIGRPAVGGPRLAVGAAQGGAWSAPAAWPIVAAHLAVLPDGRVITWVSSDVAGDTQRHSVHVWTPGSGTFVEYTNGVHNVFCSAQAFTPDGRLLVAGGHIADNKGLKQAATFNYLTNGWEKTGSMSAGRWYPTATTMASGGVAIVAGSDENASGNLYPEVWDGTSFRALAGAPLSMPYYPWAYPAPDGRLFVAGPDRLSMFLNPSGSGAWSAGPASAYGYRDWGSSVMYAPGKIMILGGGDTPTNSVELIDLNAVGAGWRSAAPMQFARKQINALVLPNGRVLALGGSAGQGFNDESKPVLAAEWWDPATDAWTTLSSMAVPRMYHSSAVLLPDARVLYAGGGRCGSCAQNHYDAELFSPPYLFKADGTPAARPQITAAPASVGYGQTFAVQTADPAAIARVTWVRLPSTTHSFDQNQGFNELAFTRTAGGLSVTAPANAYLATPGHYMLFIVDAAGVPSVAKVVQVTGSASLPAPPAAPAAPTAAAVTVVNNQQLRVRWTDNAANEASFRVERCAGSGCANFAEVAQAPANSSVLLDGGLADGTAYSYRVRAENSGGYSAYSNVASATTASGAARPAGPLLHAATGLCLDVIGASREPAARTVLYACHSDANQQWALAPIGSAGEVHVYDTMCLDAASGLGNDGDAIITYGCNGQVNQQWTLTAAGQLRGINGKCVTPAPAVPGELGGLVPFVLGPCTGAAGQRWSTGAGADRPPVAEFTVSCSGMSCALGSGASSDDNGITAREWDFGDGTTAGDVVAPLKTYTAPGTYQVTLTVRDGAGQSATKTQSATAVPVNKPPTATFNSTCSGLTCTFTDASIDADGTVQSWLWAFGDGTTSGDRNPAPHAYAAAGTYEVTLTVTDNVGGKGAQSKSVTATGPSPAPNTPPTARFTPACTNLSCTFTNTSVDADGRIASSAWTFGDGGTSTAASPTHTYAGASTYTVTLTVVDDRGAPGTSTTQVVVTAPAPPPPPPPAPVSGLAARGYKVKGVQTVDLTWTTTMRGQPVDVFRNGARLRTVGNTGAHTDTIGAKGGATYSYRVCLAGTNSCTNDATVVF